MTTRRSPALLGDRVIFMLSRSYEVERRRRALALPLAAEKVLDRALTSLHAASGRRVWGVKASNFPSEVGFYRAQHVANDLKGPRPELRTQVDAAAAESLALKLDASSEFLEMAQQASPFVSPVLLYYGAAHATGAYSRAFFSWRKDSQKHGVSVTHKPSLSKTEIRFEASGHFQRLSAASFLLTGNPTPYSELVTYVGTPEAHTEPGGLLENLSQSRIPQQQHSLTLGDLMRVDLRQEVEKLRLQCGLHKWRGLPTTLFLWDFLLIFIASSIARYDVIGWRAVLEGKSNDYRLRFDAAFERFRDAGFSHVAYTLSEPRVFWAIESQSLEPELTWDTTTQKPPSPYSDWEIAQAVLE